MEVQGIGHGIGGGHGVEKAQKHPKSALSANKASTSDAVPEPSPSDGAKTRGVIRLLQEGHFKGVADVRLRINFFDELMGIQQGKIQSAFQEAAPGLLEAVNEHLDTLLASGELTEEQVAAVESARAAFSAAVGQLSKGVSEGTHANEASILDGLESAFSSLVSVTASLVVPIATTNSTLPVIMYSSKHPKALKSISPSSWNGVTTLDLKGRKRRPATCANLHVRTSTTFASQTVDGRPLSDAFTGGS